jgi:hypothetical protein
MIRARVLSRASAINCGRVTNDPFAADNVTDNVTATVRGIIGGGGDY